MNSVTKQNKAAKNNNSDVNTDRPRRRLPNDPNRAIQEMMTVIERLRLALDEETAALRMADTKTFLSLQDQKLTVAHEYLEGMSQLLSRKDDLKKANPALLDKLEIMRGEFSDTAHENHAALERMKNGMKRLGERIMETAREASRKQRQIIYGGNGQMQSGMKTTMGVNESA